jgi:hypothetical protein
MKGETTKQKGKPLGKTLKKIPKAISMSPNLKNTSTCQTSLPKTFCKNEKAKEVEPQGTPRILMSSREQQNSTRGMNPKGKPNVVQAKHL